jgi:hypothetical protein
MRINNWVTVGAVLALAALGAPTPAGAGPVTFSVTVDTSNLNGAFTLDYQLVNGSGNPAGNNSLTISQLALTGGSLVPPTTLNGNPVPGDITSRTGISFTDNGFLGDLQQPISLTGSPSSVSFQVGLTTNVNTGPAASPDEFTFAILDAGGSEIPTTDSNGNDAFVDVVIASSNPSIEAFGSVDGTVPAPAIIASVPVPEPAGLMLAALVTPAAAYYCWRRRP